MIWTPPYPTGYALNGFTIERKVFEDQERFQCFDITPIDFERARLQGFTDIIEARVWATPTDQKDPASGPWTYRIVLRQTHDDLRLNSSDAIAAFAARADGTIVEGRAFVGSACRLTGPNISIIWVVTPTPRSPLRICGAEVEKADWEGAQVIATDIQVPFQAVNPATPDLDSERALAVTRAQPNPLNGEFAEVSRYGNVAYGRHFDAAAFHVTSHDPDAERSNWDTTPLGFVLAATAVDPAWRRALGFGFLDRFDLTDGQAYDYRISGHVPRADRDEARHDFHTVPRGQSLPRNFRLGDLELLCFANPVVEVEEAGEEPIPLWKGIRCDGLWLFLPEPTDRIAMDGFSDGALELTGMVSHAPVTTIVEPLNGRTVFDFGTPVQQILVKGPGFFSGFMPRPLAPGLDPKEPVEISEFIRGIRFQATAPPDPPTDIEAINLGSALRTARRQQRDDTIGFEVSWMPPLRMDPGILNWWPADASTAPPTDVAGYRLERSWDGQPFVPPNAAGGLHMPSRNRDPRTEALVPGSDMLAVYPPANATGLAEAAEVRAIDAFDDIPPPLGTNVTYGISSVDAIGRASARALAPPARLEKRTRPPVPIAPPSPTPADTEADSLVTPSGVQVRLLQATDPDLTPAERARVDAEGDIVVLTWGWGPQQRELDPLVEEFRIYGAEGRLADITATITSAPVALASGGWRLSCNLSRPVEANEFVGTRVILGLAYSIAAHGAGTSAIIDLEPATADPSRSPVGTIMTLIRTDGGAEDPEAWDNRLGTVPRVPLPADPQATESYEIALPAAWISVSPASRRQIRSFGVSAADGEPYVTDRRAAIEPSPRPGNESPVSGGEVIARYRGRPTLAIADLGPVASVTLDRAGADQVHLDFEPANYLPSAAPAAQPRMRIERAPASAVLPRIVIEASGISLMDSAGAKTPWALSPSDEAALRIEASERAISDRFLAHAAARLTDIGEKFQIVADANPSISTRDMLPNSAGRWVYRLRALDAGGRASLEGQVLELVVRIPQPARAILPQLTGLDLQAGIATVNLQVRGSGARVFLVTSNDSRVSVARAEMSTIRNRPDLDISDRFFVRDDRGTLLTSTEVTPIADGTVSQVFAVPDRAHFHVWAYAVSADGVPSRLVGPLHAFRGYPAEGV
ncbi:hypothetical protein Q5Y75_15110 [Ruegeria sp. 2205SS24-7]|uniref:hypothetical protein n=1 Tax=Ruegeria discodermiae TaxID=3064389 RepID=UPI0027412C74|nr:hypothetical protein [Ruegeria sp. 2205SS24-7]MDP5218556.1 hypothetical protein [Ruegeria sp. 2205SS24-7]